MSTLTRKGMVSAAILSAVEEDLSRKLNDDLSNARRELKDAALEICKKYGLLVETQSDRFEGSARLLIEYVSRSSDSYARHQARHAEILKNALEYLPAAAFKQRAKSKAHALLAAARKASEETKP